MCLLCSCLALTPATTAPALTPVLPVLPGRQTLVFSDFFQEPDWAAPDAVWCPYTSAYPDGRTNPGNGKLDQLTPQALSAENGVLRISATTVTGAPDGPWSTGLITTEPYDGGPCGGNGFTLQPDDYALVHLRLPDRNGGGGHGAWPAIWTWKDGGNEIDLLEWHAEIPDRAEFVNHVQHADGKVRSPLLGYGAWVWIGARLGTDAVTWYLGDTPADMQAVYSDGVGVPPDWQAYLIINLSVSAQPGRTPTTAAPITTEIAGIQIYR